MIQVTGGIKCPAKTAFYKTLNGVTIWMSTPRQH